MNADDKKKLDLDDMAYMLFQCPVCNVQNHLGIDQINFCVDLDCSVAADGSTDAWLACQCEHCGANLERWLSRRPDKD